MDDSRKLPLWSDLACLVLACWAAATSWFCNIPRISSRTAGFQCQFKSDMCWVYQSWLVSLFLDCPLGMDLHCPNATSKAVSNIL